MLVSKSKMLEINFMNYNITDKNIIDKWIIVNYEERLYLHNKRYLFS